MTSAVDFEVVLRDTLINNDDVYALVGNKVFPLVIPQGTKLPCITFQRLRSYPANTLSGASGLEKVDLEIDVWGMEYGQTKDVAKAVRAAMPAQGPWGAHLRYDSDDYEYTGPYYRVLMRYTVWFLENAED
jgi:hypothetical protein